MEEPKPGRLLASRPHPEVALSNLTSSRAPAWTRGLPNRRVESAEKNLAVSANSVDEEVGKQAVQVGNEGPIPLWKCRRGVQKYGGVRLLHTIC